MHVINYSRDSEKGQGLGSGYKWLAGLVFRVCIGGPNISGVQISRDSTK